MVTTDQKGRALGGASRILPRGVEPHDVVIEGVSVTPDGAATVQVVTIDGMVPPDRNVSVIQLDVELLEQEALSGAMKTIKRCLPVIVVESLPEEDWLSENLLPLGYRVTHQVELNWILMPT